MLSAYIYDHDIFAFIQPGLAAAVAYRGETILNIGYGVVDKKSKSARTPDGDTIFRVGSISKVFVVSAVIAIVTH